jgi:hypothetical protein
MTITKEEAAQLLNDIAAAFSEGQRESSDELVKRLMEFTGEKEYSYLLWEES